MKIYLLNLKRNKYTHTCYKCYSDLDCDYACKSLLNIQLCTQHRVIFFGFCKVDSPFNNDFV